MLYSARIDTEELSDFTRAIFSAGGRDYPVILGKGDSAHYFTNIPLDEKPIFKCPVEHSIQDLSFQESAYETAATKAFSSQLKDRSGVRYRSTVVQRPKRAVVMFPAYRGDRGWENAHGVMPVEKFGFEETLYLSFQDPYFVNGSYFLSDNYGKSPLPIAVAIIQNELDAWGLLASDMSLVGSSKGANIAAMISQYFKDNQLIVCGYANNIARWVAHNGQACLTSALDYYNISYPDAAEILFSEAENKETHWFYSTRDHLANDGCETRTAKHLVKHACHESHGELFRSRWDSVSALVRGRHP